MIVLSLYVSVLLLDTKEITVSDSRHKDVPGRMFYTHSNFYFFLHLPRLLYSKTSHIL